MKYGICIALIASLLAPFAGLAEDKNIVYGGGGFYRQVFGEFSDQWRACQSDDQCTVIITRNCSIRLAVNKAYSWPATYLANARDACLSMPEYPAGMVEKCLSNKCELWVPPEYRLGAATDGECPEAAKAGIKPGMTRTEIGKYAHLEASGMRYHGERYFFRALKAGEKADDLPMQRVCMLRIDFRPHGLADEIYKGPDFMQWLRAHPWAPRAEDVAVTVSAPFFDILCCKYRQKTEGKEQ